MKIVSLAVLLLGTAVVNASETPILLETDTLVLGINGDGRVTCVVDRSCGRDYLNRAADTAFAIIKEAGNVLYPVRTVFEEGRLTVDFDGSGRHVVFNVTSDSRWLSFEVASLACGAAEELVFARIPLTLQPDPFAPFAVSPLALNLKTNCTEIPGLSSSLGGFMAYKRYGFEGACGMVIACPASEMRDTLKSALKSSSDLVASPLGGPWRWMPTSTKGRT